MENGSLVWVEGWSGTLWTVIGMVDSERVRCRATNGETCVFRVGRVKVAENYRILIG